MSDNGVTAVDPVDGPAPSVVNRPRPTTRRSSTRRSRGRPIRTVAPRATARRPAPPATGRRRGPAGTANRRCPAVTTPTAGRPGAPGAAGEVGPTGRPDRRPGGGRRGRHRRPGGRAGRRRRRRHRQRRRHDDDRRRRRRHDRHHRHGPRGHHHHDGGPDRPLRRRTCSPSPWATAWSTTASEGEVQRGPGHRLQRAARERDLLPPHDRRPRPAGRHRAWRRSSTTCASPTSRAFVGLDYYELGAGRITWLQPTRGLVVVGRPRAAVPGRDPAGAVTGSLAGANR